MKKNNLITATLVVAIVCGFSYFTACKKETVEKVENQAQSLVALPTLFSIYNDFSQPSDGVVGVQSFATIHSQGSPNITYSGFVKQDDEKMMNLGNLKIGDIQLDNIEGNIYHKSFDSNNITSYGRSNTFTFDGFSQNLYIPKIMQVNTTINENVDIRPGFNITWNADSENKLGVAILVEYDPTHPINKVAHTDSNTKKVVNSVYLPKDEGTYTFKSDDFKDIPTGSNVLVRIGRANYKIVNWNNKKLKLIGFSYIGFSIDY